MIAAQSLVCAGSLTRGHGMVETEPRWSLMRLAMLDKIRQLTQSEPSVAKTNFGGWQSPGDLYVRVSVSFNLTMS